MCVALVIFPPHSSDIVPIMLIWLSADVIINYSLPLVSFVSHLRLRYTVVTFSELLVIDDTYPVRNNFPSRNVKDRFASDMWSFHLFNENDIISFSSSYQRRILLEINPVCCLVPPKIQNC